MHPQTHTEEMHSWFPIFFPLKEPMHCPAGAPIQAHMWRCSANHKVRTQRSIRYGAAAQEGLDAQPFSVTLRSQCRYHTRKSFPSVFVP